MFIDVHCHMHGKPQFLEQLVNSGKLKQVWLMDSSYKLTEKYEVATQEEMLEVSRNYKGFFIPFGFLDFRKPVSVVDELKERGFIGLKAIKPLKPYDDESYYPYYERAEQLNMPILFHTGMVNAQTYKNVPPMLSQSGTNMKPSALYTIASLFPDLTLIGAHLGYPWSEEVVSALRCTTNLYFDISGGFRHEYSEWILKHLHYSAPLKDGTMGSFCDKILMGIDDICGREENHQQILRGLNYWDAFFESHGWWFNWWPEIEKIKYKNAQKIMEKFL